MNKKRIIAFVTGIVVLILAGMFIGPFFSAESGAKRTYNKILNSFESSDLDSIHAALSPNYSDKSGFNRDDLTELCRLFRKQIYSCKIFREEKSAVFNEDTTEATITISVNVAGKGTDYVDDILQYSRMVSTPMTVKLVRESWKPWDWKIVSIEHSFSARAKGLKVKLEQFERVG